MFARRLVPAIAWRGLLVAGVLFLAGCPQPQNSICASGRVCPPHYTCAANQDICILGNCGNGIIDTGSGEVCDDGNVINDDACNSTCTSDNTCGNGIKDDTFADPTRNEVCDDGRLNGQPGKCSADCKSNGLCGNGQRDNGEDCDYCVADDASIVNQSTDGATDGLSAGDGSSGDGDADADTSGVGGASGAGGATGAGGAGGQKACALGITESRVCNNDCTTARCGDRKINQAAGEQCDDGGESKTCNVDCTTAFCGDGKVNLTALEQCDVLGGLDTPNCNGAAAGSAGVACRFTECGDGYVNQAAGETCDTLGGMDTADCNGSSAMPGVACHKPACGDGYINMAAGESCDELGGVDTAKCNGKGAGAASCQAPVCGDGHINAAFGETCEVGTSGNDTPTCNGTMAPLALQCRTAKCTDGYINTAANEQCELAASGADTAICNGVASGALQCRNHACGDGYVNTQAGEACDDHNTTSGDGCNVSCQKEPGFSCTSASPTVCTTICGDGFVVPGKEPCDDFNTISCGGCNAGCTATQLPSNATGSITAVGSTLLSSGDSFTLSDGLHAPVTFEITNKTPASGHVAILRGTNSDAPTLAGRIAVAINGVDALAISAVSSGALVSLTNSIIGSGGNVTIKTTVKAAGFVISGMAGGAAYDCAAGVGCGANSDCASGVCCLTGTNGGSACAKNTCLPSTCNDGVLNGTESSVDCGGLSCAPCIGAKTCATGSDCVSGVCDKTCQEPTCSDGVQNGTETDQDCGVACPGQACTPGLKCSVAADCDSVVCTGGICQFPACNDHVQNGGEADVDCGAVCTGQLCADSSKCGGNGDCSSGVCTGSKCVKAPTCNDGIPNQGETGTDCGGPCPLCPGAVCTADVQCASKSCPTPDAGVADGGSPPARTCD